MVNMEKIIMLHEIFVNKKLIKFKSRINITNKIQYISIKRKLYVFVFVVFGRNLIFKCRIS